MAGELKLKAKFDSSEVRSGVADATRHISKFGGALQTALGLGLHGVISNTIGLIARLGRVGLKFGADFEMIGVQFEALIGNTAKAKRLMAELREFSVKTPFTPEDVFKAGKILLTQFPSKSIGEEIKTLGEIAAVTGKDLSELSLIYAKVAERGKVNARILNQMANANIPISRALAQVKNVDMSSIRELSEQGKISFKDFRDAVKLLSNDFSGLERASQTVKGRFSTLVGAFQEFAATIMEANKGGILTFLDRLIRLLSTDPSNGGQGGLARALGFMGDRFNDIADLAEISSQGLQYIWNRSPMSAKNEEERAEARKQIEKNINTILDERHRNRDRRAHRPGFPDRIGIESTIAPGDRQGIGLGQTLGHAAGMAGGDNAGIFLSGRVGAMTDQQILQKQLEVQQDLLRKWDEMVMELKVYDYMKRYGWGIGGTRTGAGR